MNRRRSFAIHLRAEKSRPVEDAERVPLELGRDLIRFLDDPVYRPVIYRA